VKNQAALLHFWSDQSTTTSKPGIDKQVESIRELMGKTGVSSSTTKKLEEPAKSVPTTMTTTTKKDPSPLSDEEEGGRKKPSKPFLPFNQKAVDSAAGIMLTGSNLESNLQDQRDELMALRSIFDSDFRKESEGTSSGDIYRIKIKPVGAGNSFIELRFSYPPNYPSDGPPAVSVSAEGWLTPYAIHLLQHNLDKLLKESEGQVVVYTLGTWMQEESWSYLMSRSSYSNPIVIHFSPLVTKRTVSKPTLSTSSSQPSMLTASPVNYQRAHPLTVAEGKNKITIVAFYARIRSLAQVQQLIREIKDKQKEKPTSPKQHGTSEQYLVAYRFASTDRSPVTEGSDGDEFGSGGSSESILRLLQKLNLYDISVVVRLRWPSPPGVDVYKKMLAYISTILKSGGQPYEGLV